MADAFSEVLALAGGDMEKLAREVVRQLEKSTCENLILKERLLLQTEVIELQAQLLDAKAVKRPVGRPRKAQPIKFGRAAIKRVAGRPNETGLPTDLETLASLARWRRERNGGTVIDHARYLANVFAKQGVIEPSEVERIAKNIARQPTK
jgi:hypothetical protein